MSGRPIKRTLRDAVDLLPGVDRHRSPQCVWEDLARISDLAVVPYSSEISRKWL